jgi:hypothetical protein
LGTAGPANPFYAVCLVDNCYFIVVDFFGNFNGQALREINANYRGIKATFCPVWIKSSAKNNLNIIFMLSDCGNGDFTLYKTTLETLEVFEEVPLPESFKDKDLTKLDIQFDDFIAILYFKNSTSAWIVRRMEFDFIQQIYLLPFIQNP